MKIKFFITFTALFLLTLTACEKEDMYDFAKNGTSHTWEYAGSAGISAGTASSISVAVYDDTPYVAYIEASIPKVVKYTGSAWIQVGPDIDTSATDINITIYNGTPYVIYSTSTAAYVKYFNGSSWAAYGSSASLSSTAYNDIIFSSGTAYIGYITGSAFALQYTAGSWGQINTACSGDSYLTLSATSSNLYFTYAFSNAVTVMKNTLPSPGTWMPITPTAQSGLYFSSQIYSGMPAVAFSDANNSFKVSVIRYTGTSNIWSNLGTPGFSDGTASYISMTLFEGTLHVAFRDESTVDNKLTAMRYDSGSWIVDDIPRFTPSGVGELDIAGGSRKMFVAFSDDSVSGRLSVMQY